MPTVRKPKRKARGVPGQPLDNDKVSAALAMETTSGAKDACAAFGLSRRSLQRYKAFAKQHPDSDLAKAVTAARRRALRRVDDLLTQTWEAFLHRLQELLPEATMAETVEGAKVIGELRITQEALGVDDHQPKDDTAKAQDHECFVRTGQGPAAPEAEDRHPGQGSEFEESSLTIQ
jgi:hypothetical protein